MLNFVFRKASLYLMMNHTSSYFYSLCCLTKVEEDAINKASKYVVQLLRCFDIGDASSIDFDMSWSVEWGG